MQSPVFGVRQRASQNIHFKLKFHRLEVRAGNCHDPLVLAGFDIGGHTYLHPYRLGATGWYVAHAYDVQYISDQQRIPFRLVISMSATSFPVFVQFVRHDVADKMGADFRCRYNG